MRHIQLVNHLSPGDIVMLTAAVRDLKLALRDGISIRVETSAPALWENNHHIAAASGADTAWERVPCEYPLVNHSNQLPYHFIHGFRKFLEDRLRMRIPCTAFYGDIHLSDAERRWMSQVEELAGIGARFWVINAGGKRDYTTKWWTTAAFQAVVDSFSDRLLEILSRVVDGEQRDEVRRTLGALCKRGHQRSPDKGQEYAA